MIWRLLDNLLSRLVGRLLRLSPVDPKREGADVSSWPKAGFTDRDGLRDEACCFMGWRTLGGTHYDDCPLILRQRAEWVRKQLKTW